MAELSGDGSAIFRFRLEARIAGPQVFGGLIGDGQTAQAFHVLKVRMRLMNAPHRSMRNNLCAGLFAFLEDARPSTQPILTHAQTLFPP